MKKKILLSVLAVVLLVVFLWGSGIIPKQIAKIYGTNYVQEHFSETNLKYKSIEWSPYHGDYIVTFRNPEGKTYSCVVYPRFFPICLGQGFATLEEDYQETYDE